MSAPRSKGSNPFQIEHKLFRVARGEYTGESVPLIPGESVPPILWLFAELGAWLEWRTGMSAPRSKGSNPFQIEHKSFRVARGEYPGESVLLIPGESVPPILWLFAELGAWLEWRTGMSAPL